MRAKKHHTYARSFSSFLLFLFTSFVYPFFLLSLCLPLSASISFITLRQLGQKSQAFGSVGDSAIQHPVCHNTGTTKCGYCQLMAVYPLKKPASHSLSRLKTCQPMIVEPCTSQTSACQITGCRFFPN